MAIVLAVISSAADIRTAANLMVRVKMCKVREGRRDCVHLGAGTGCGCRKMRHAHELSYEFMFYLNLFKPPKHSHFTLLYPLHHLLDARDLTISEAINGCFRFLEYKKNAIKPFLNHHSNLFVCLLILLSFADLGDKLPETCLLTQFV